MQQIKDTDALLWETLMIKNPSVLKIVNQNFPRYRTCTEKHRVLMSFISDYFQQKVMADFIKVKKTQFWVLLGPFLPANFRENWTFSGKSASATFSCFRFLLMFRVSEKINSFHEKLVREVQTDGHTDAWKSLNSQDIPCWGSNKYEGIQSYEKTTKFLLKFKFKK